MIDISCIDLFPATVAWRFDLDSLGGPEIVVLREHAGAAETRLLDQLVCLGKAPDRNAASVLMTNIETERVAVIW